MNLPFLSSPNIVEPIVDVFTQVVGDECFGGSCVPCSVVGDVAYLLFFEVVTIRRRGFNEQVYGKLLVVEEPHQ